MKEKFSVFNVASLEDLRQQLADVPQNRGTRFAVLSSSDPAVVVCSFVFEAATSKKLLECVEKEAASLLSLPVRDIVFDHHVFYSSGDKTHGVLACVPKNIFDAYINVLNEKKLTVICIMPAIVAAANAFFQDHRKIAGRVCLLNFTSSKTIQCAIFYNQRCELLREIRFENLDTIQRDIVQTLKSVYAGSAAKKFDHIFIGGDIDQNIPIGKWMEEQFQIQPQMLTSLNISRAICSKRYDLNVNLSKKYSFTIRWRRRLVRILNGMLLVLFGVACLLGAVIYLHQRQAQELKASFDADAYADAVQLEKMLQ